MNAWTRVGSLHDHDMAQLNDTTATYRLIDADRYGLSIGPANRTLGDKA